MISQRKADNNLIFHEYSSFCYCNFPFLHIHGIALCQSGKGHVLRRIRMWKWLRDKTLRQNVLGQESELEELRETSYDGNKVSSTLIKKSYTNPASSKISTTNWFLCNILRWWLSQVMSDFCVPWTVACQAPLSIGFSSNSALFST